MFTRGWHCKAWILQHRFRRRYRLLSQCCVVTHQVKSIDDGIGMPLWHLTLCLAVAWVFIFFSLVKGVQSLEKVAYFTAIFPYVVLVTVLVRGVTLPGAWEGIEYFIKPQWNKIFLPEVWYAAVGQCFFSLGTGTGPITMFSSYNSFRHTAYRDALTISSMDTFTSLLAGFTFFSVLGHLSHLNGVDIENVTTAGPGLIFVSYPSAISEFPRAPQLFAVFFFLMLFTLGIGSANALAGAPITILCDQFPKVRKWQMTLGCCILGFLSGLIYVTPGGQFMVTFTDYYDASFLLYFLCMMEVIAIAWFYGMHKFIRDIEFMLGIKVAWYWKICWGGVIPVGLAAVLVYTFAAAKALLHEGLAYPDYLHAIGWTITGIATAFLPAWGLHAVFKTSAHSFCQRLKGSFGPKKKWGPRASKYRRAWDLFKTFGESKHYFPISDTQALKSVHSWSKGSHFSYTRIRRRYNSVAQFGPRCRGSPQGKLHWYYLENCTSFLRKKMNCWVITENGFEAFNVMADAEKHVMTHVNCQMMPNNDYAIVINF